MGSRSAQTIILESFGGLRLALAANILCVVGLMVLMLVFEVSIQPNVHEESKTQTGQRQVQTHPEGILLSRGCLRCCWSGLAAAAANASAGRSDAAIRLCRAKAGSMGGWFRRASGGASSCVLR